MDTITPEIALWILDSAFIPVMGWAVTITFMMLGMKKDCSRLIHMHEHADDYGFGTVRLQQQQGIERAEMRQLVLDNTRAMREVAHYIRWWIENQTGQKPPPPLDIPV